MDNGWPYQLQEVKSTQNSQAPVWPSKAWTKKYEIKGNDYNETRDNITRGKAECYILSRDHYLSAIFDI